jgi:hypothetical protein
MPPPSHLGKSNGKDLECAVVAAAHQRVGSPGRLLRPAATTPHRIISVYRVADRDDLEERAKHFTEVLEAAVAAAW